MYLWSMHGISDQESKFWWEGSDRMTHKKHRYIYFKQVDEFVSYRYKAVSSETDIF